MILTLLIAFFSLIALMVIHEFGHFIIAKKFGVKVEEFGIGYPPRIYGKKFGETIYSINLIPFGAFVRIFGEEGDIHDAKSFSNLAIWKRMLIVLGGVLAFWVAAIVIFSVLFSIGAKVPVGDQDIQGVSDVSVTIMSVQKGSPAEAAGLKSGDIITGVSEAGSPELIEVKKIGDFQEFVKTSNGDPVTVWVDRNGQDVKFDVTPRVNPPEGQGATGIALERMATIIQKVPWYMAPVKGIAFTWEVTVKSLQGIFSLLANLFSGRGVPSGAELAGPIGITIFLANAASYGVGFFLYFIGSISVLVAIFNLFPIPALDGGKMVFLAIEKVMGKPVPVKVEQALTIIFFVLLILMSLFITVRFDIPRLVDFWKAGL
ncbi:site-2 protease family protein [Candidatus Parcubacteria bacterium]|nr:site-2 protease family protein [Candidatus Parcubacteria bacterium]